MSLPEQPEYIPLAHPDIGPDEEAEILDVLRSGVLALGPRAVEFEQLTADFVGAAWGVAVSSGTGGLHSAVRALGIGAGDCVPMSSFSFISTANTVRYEGAQPIFIDIDPNTLCLSPERLGAYLASCVRRGNDLIDPGTGLRVAAVMTADIFGHPQKLDEILAHVAHHNLPIIADASEALGSRFRTDEGEWVHAGTGAAATVVAFYPNKQITTGEGGMVLGNDPALQAELRALRNQGRDPDSQRLRHDEIGFNYRMDELSAALGLVQMRRIEEILGRRAAVVARYDDALADLDIGRPKAAEWADPAWFVYFLRVGERDRDAIVSAINQRGVASKAYFDVPTHRQPTYAGQVELVPEPLPYTNAAAAEILILPFFSTMTDDQVDRVAATVREVLST